MIRYSGVVKSDQPVRNRCLEFAAIPSVASTNESSRRTASFAAPNNEQLAIEEWCSEKKTTKSEFFGKRRLVLQKRST